MLNHIIIMGRLTAEPDLRKTPKGKSVTTFTVAVSRDYDMTQTDFIGCVAWEKTAEVVKNYFTKGEMICVSGRLESRQYEKDGQKRTVWEIVAERIYFGGGKRENTPKEATLTEMDDDDGDLPF